MLAGAVFALNAVLNLALTLALARVLPPDVYGELAVWLAAVLFIATAAFDWARFSAMRFYTPRARREQPSVRRTLDLAFVGSMPVAAVSVLAFASFQNRAGDAVLLAVVLALVIGNAAFEYFGALARARFDTRAYAATVAIRHILVFCLVVPLAWRSGDVETTLILLMLSIWPSVLFAVVSLNDGHHPDRRFDPALASRYAGYGLPLVSAEAIYQAIALINRVWLVESAGYAAAGVYSLAFDLSLRLIAVAATIGDVALFPRLVAEHEDGRGDVTRRVSRNLGLMAMALAPVALGFVLLAEPFAAVILAPAFRSPFNAIILMTVAAAALYVAQTYVLRPAFQLAETTRPFLRAATAALLVNVAVIAVSAPADLLLVARAHALGLAVGLVVIIAHAARAGLIAPPWRDLGKIALALCAMTTFVWPLREVGPAWAAIVMASVAGGLAYAVVILATDAVGSGEYLARKLRRERRGDKRPRTPPA